MTETKQQWRRGTLRGGSFPAKLGFGGFGTIACSDSTEGYRTIRYRNCVTNLTVLDAIKRKPGTVVLYVPNPNTNGVIEWKFDD